MSRIIPGRYAVPFLIAGILLAAAAVGLWGELSAQDTPRDSETCLGCHGGQDATLAATAHRLKPGAAGKGLACTDCHAGDRRHWEEDPAKFPMTNPSELDARAQARVCASCHQNSHQQNMVEKNVHPRHDVNCSGCHSVHKSKQAALLKQDEKRLCWSCHPKVEGQFARSYRHPVNDGIVKCSECHLTLDETSRELSLNGTNMCMKCHGEFAGPFVYEHPAALDFSTQEGGCLACHEAHGSDNPRMLRQPYAPPHYQLCSQCHSVPRHNSNSMHGTQLSGVPCNDCHSDIHGSYTSRLFLSESLEGQGCFNVGCHQL
jgi:DmsE family decaheme c-type cytochrome